MIVFFFFCRSLFRQFQTIGHGTMRTIECFRRTWKKRRRKKDERTSRKHPAREKNSRPQTTPKICFFFFLMDKILCVLIWIHMTVFFLKREKKRSSLIGKKWSKHTPTAYLLWCWSVFLILFLGIASWLVTGLGQHRPKGQEPWRHSSFCSRVR